MDHIVPIFLGPTMVAVKGRSGTGAIRWAGNWAHSLHAHGLQHDPRAIIVAVVFLGAQDCLRRIWQV